MVTPVRDVHLENASCGCKCTRRGATSAHPAFVSVRVVGVGLVRTYLRDLSCSFWKDEMPTVCRRLGAQSCRHRCNVRKTLLSVRDAGLNERAVARVDREHVAREQFGLHALAHRRTLATLASQTRGRAAAILLELGGVAELPGTQRKHGRRRWGTQRARSKRRANAPYTLLVAQACLDYSSNWRPILAANRLHWRS